MTEEEKRYMIACLKRSMETMQGRLSEQQYKEYYKETEKKIKILEGRMTEEEFKELAIEQRDIKIE